MSASEGHSPRRLIHLLSSNFRGGVERYALDICRHFKDSGWSVTAYTRDARVVDDVFRDAKIDIRHAPLRGYMDVATIASLTRHLRHEMPGTVMHVHRYRDAFIALAARKLARRKDIKVVVTRHRVKTSRDGWLYRRICRNVHAHIFPSRIALEGFMRTWSRRPVPAPAERLYLLHDSVLTKSSSSQEPEKGPVIGLYYGPLMPGKGLETIIDALPRLRGKRFRMCIAGNGNSDYADSLRRRAISRGVMDMIDWKKGSADSEALIAECHFGVQPSVMAEAFGLFNLECLALGKPVVCSNNGAQPEYISNGEEGLLVTPADASALADALERLATDSDFRHRCGEAGRHRFVNDFSWETFAEKLEDIYRR